MAGPVWNVGNQCQLVKPTFKAWDDKLDGDNKTSFIYATNKTWVAVYSSDTVIAAVCRQGSFLILL